MLFKEFKLTATCLLLAGALFHANAFAVIQHAGQLTQNETWDSSDTHLVTGDVLIPSGVTLTISGSAYVEFAALTDSGNLGTDASRCELIVDGGTLHVGEVESSVYLTSNATSPTAGDWWGIRVLNGGELLMSGAQLNYAVTAVDYRQNGAVNFNPIIRANNIEELSGDAIYFETQGGAQIAPIISYNQLWSIGGRGIYLKSSGTSTLVQGTISSNTVEAAGLNGIYLYADGQARHALWLENNNLWNNGASGANNEERAGLGLHHNGTIIGGYSEYTINQIGISGSAHDGIYIYHNEADINLTLQNSGINNNGGNGVYSIGSGRTLNATLVENQISNNGAEGLHLENGDQTSINHTNLTYNNIHHNGGRGLGLYQRAHADLVYNSIHDNTGPGIHLDLLQSGMVNFNNLYGNDTTSGIALYNDGATAVDARYNWWGDTIYAEITAGGNPKNLSGIHDSHDDGSKGEVNYGDWLTALQSEPLSATRIISWIKDPIDGQEINTANYRIEGLAVAKDPIYQVDVSTDGGATWHPATGTANWSYDWNITSGNGTYQILSRAGTNYEELEIPSAGHTVTVNIPAIPAPVTLDTVTSPTHITPAPLSGGKEADTAVYINNVEVVPLDASTTWNYDQALSEGLNNFSIEARNAAGNSSTPVAVSIVLDTQAPVISSLSPTDNSYLNQRPASVVAAIQEAGSGLDNAAIIASATLTQGVGTTVTGSWSIDGSNQLTFTPDSPLSEDTYVVAATISDLAGNTTPLAATFTYDATPPAIPSVDPPVTSPTNSSSQQIGGYKEANTSIWINGSEVVALDADTTWSYLANLQPGPNSFTIYALDRANNPSGNLIVDITFDDTAPPPVSVLTVDAAGIGSLASLDWTAYDESLYGDIAGYRIYQSTQTYADVGAMTPVASLPAGTKHFDATGLVKGQTYHFAVVAYDNNGNSNNTVTPVTATPSDIVPPEEITNPQLSLTADSVSISWTHSANSNGDLAGYKLYFNNDGGTTLAPNVDNHSYTGLSQSTRYPCRITAIDTDGNESSGVTLTVITLMPNPTGLSGTSLNNRVELTWNPVLPMENINLYAVYVSTTDFTSVTGLSPALYIGHNRNSASVSGLDNGTTYYFAVTTINYAGGETQAVTTISLAPQADTDGPTINDFTFEGATLTDGATLTGAGTLAVALSDISGISRVEFLLDSAPLATDINGSDGYKAYWNLPETTDGAHTLSVTAYDTLDNPTSLSRSVNVALAAPPAPAISAPADGTTTNQTSLTVSGSAAPQTEVLVQIDGSQVAGPLTLDANNRFQTGVTLNAGANVITASAQNRGGTSPASAAVTVTLDNSVPDTPLGLNAQSQTEGQVLLTWNSSSDERVVSYDVYRAGQSFSDIAQAVKANSNPVAGNRFVDLPLAEGTFHYRVVALNDVGTASLPSNESSALADSVLPRAVLIDYTPQGNFDANSGRMAAGQVDVTVEVSEPLLTTPFLSLTPPGGVPMAVSLSQTSETGYAGSFQITDTTPSGTAYAVFSARDQVGNRGNAIDQGASILIDTAGPAVAQLTLAPAAPIQNDQLNPVEVNLELTLDQPVKSGTLPTMNYLLSGAGRQPVAITNLTQQDTLVWRGSFPLPADAGLTEVENLSFEFTAQDDLDTVSHAINTGNSYQVYQGGLPPLEVPANLTAVALAGGGAELQWRAVADATEYQLYRQAPGESALTAYSRVTGDSFTDAGLTDGDYSYSVASIRQANAQESVSGQSDRVTVTSDSLASQPPENLSLELVGAGIKALWDAPTGSTESLTYNLYRASGTSLTDVSGLTPIQTHIVADGNGVLGYIDTAPDENASVYAVTAVDTVGNESAPSTSAYLNVSLLPVASLQVSRTDGGYPVLSWSHNSGAIAGYNLYLDGSATPVNGSLLTATSYTDQGYTGNVRSYTVTAIDTNMIESLGRTVELPLVDAGPVSAAGIRRGIMNRVAYEVTNLTPSAVSGVTLKVDVDGHSHSSAAFDLAVGESKTVEMVIGGFDTLPDNAATVTTVEVNAATGERAEIVENGQIQVGEAALLAQMETQELTRGTAGQIRFSLENTSELVTEIITAQGNNPSPEITLLLEDLDGNVLSSVPFLQQVGSGVLTLSNGSTLTRIEPGARFTSDWFALPIPQSAPDQVRIRLQIDQLHYHLGEDDHLAIAGLGTSQSGVLSDTAYTVTVDSVTPASSYGDQPIVITGQALERVSAQPLSMVPLKLIITANGFERQTDLMTDSMGGYQYTFEPLPSESGIFTVSAIHPDILARPGQGQFTINRVLVEPTTLRLNLPKNYEQGFDVIRASAGEGTTATNLHLVYEAADQQGGSFPAGITLTPGAPLDLQSKQSGTLAFTILGDNSADLTGTLVLKVMSDESGTQPLALVNLEYQLSDAEPALYFSPNFVETGVAQDDSVNETITLENRGLADLTDISVSLLTGTDTPAPSWIYLLSPQSQGTLAVGGTKQIQLTANPTNQVADGIYPFKLRVTGSNHPTTDINIYVAVTQSGIGNVLFKASDIYTATLDTNGVPIPGLAGTRIRVQNEEVPSIEQTATTDSQGEVLINDLPAGRYRFRASAPNHEDLLGRLTIKPGVTTAQEIFLDFNLITVEWSVTEITIEDKYEITLQATFETDVPAAVVVLEPTSTTLPDMAVGDVFYGELRLTNHGLIRADDLQISYPASDAYFQYEFLASLPDKLEAKESLLIPYRITALSPLAPDGTASGGANCKGYIKVISANYYYKCVNGQITSGGTSHSWTHAVGASSCGGSGSASGGSIWSSPYHQYGTPSSGTSSYDSLPSAKCLPKPDCETCCSINGPSGG